MIRIKCYFLNLIVISQIKYGLPPKLGMPIDLIPAGMRPMGKRLLTKGGF